MAKKNIKKSLQTQESNFLLYKTDDGKIKVDVVFHGATVWLTLNKIAELFDTSKQNISYHFLNIFNDQELDKGATVKEILTVQQEGGREVKRSLEYYNLDAIIAVGYRVNSVRATQFRIWATKVLKEYIEDENVLRDGSKQASLGDTWSNCIGTYRETGRCIKTIHGSDHMEERASWPIIRCDSSCMMSLERRCGALAGL